MLSIFSYFMSGALFMAFVVLSAYSWYVTLMIDREELEGFNSRFATFSEILFWTEILVGMVIASIATGRWLVMIL